MPRGRGAIFSGGLNSVDQVLGAQLIGWGGGRQRSITPPQDVPCIYATKIPIELLRLCITKAPHLCSAFRHALFLIYNAFVLPKHPSFAKITYFFVAPHLIIIAPHLNLKKRCGARKIFARSATQLFKILCTPLLWTGVNQRFLGRKLKYNLSSRLDLSSFRQCRGRGFRRGISQISAYNWINRI